MVLINYSYVNRSTVSRSKAVTSSKLLQNFTVVCLNDWPVSILLLFHDKLLVSSRGLSQLFIYSREDRHLLSITTSDNDNLCDAKWTPRDNIVYTTCDSNKVMVISESGKVIITPIQMKSPRCLNASNNNCHQRRRLGNWHVLVNR